ncbi:hypothetical protein DAI22_05g142600 [Oryza sativa Japonica Group]|nr:hypothetical protein DAI22_05g142600 [Oryza sativa Japonica Group]
MDSNNKNLQPPPGYPTVDSEHGGRGRTTARGRKTRFIDGCIAALCCCWLCDLCCD